jgi:phosphoglycerate dehydrogenase-like enzyme
MQETHRLLIALGKGEVEDFLPEHLYRQVTELFPDHYFYDTSNEDEAVAKGYVKVIREYQPTVILSGWTTPPMPPETLEQIPGSIRYYCHLGGTVRRLFPREFIDKGLLVTNWGSVISESVAECALFLALACLRRGTKWAISMHTEGGWRSGRFNDNYSLLEREVGLHGFGVISQSLVEMLRPFRVRISTYSPSVPDTLLNEKGVHRAHSLDELFTRSDVLIELAPNKPENFHMVDERLLRMLRPGSCFVNVGRGAVVDTEALVRVAREGNIQVGLDVYEEEPLPQDSPLRGLTNVNMLPHLGGPTRDQRYKSGEVAVENMRRYKQGEELRFLVTSTVYDRAT